MNKLVSLLVSGFKKNLSLILLVLFVVATFVIINFKRQIIAYNGESTYFGLLFIYMILSLGLSYLYYIKKKS